MRELNILNIPNLYTLRVCAEMHLFIYPGQQLNRSEHNHIDTPTTQMHEHATRQATAGKYYLPNKHTKTTRQTANRTTQNYISTWNKIPECIRNISSIKIFKQKLKRHLLAKQPVELHNTPVFLLYYIYIYIYIFCFCFLYVVYLVYLHALHSHTSTSCTPPPD